MADTISPVVAFGSDEFLQPPPQATVSLSETTLQTRPSTPQSQPVQEGGENEEEKKPTKKRKSWGQELPTPKTNLPPRKRAKTDDEKEQRRIERVLRNRQAAQSSRERKRQEVEKLEGEKAAIEEQNQQLKERLMAVEHEKFLLAQKVAKMTAQMRSLRDSSATSTPEPSTPTLDGFDHAKIKQELDNEYSFLPTPSTSFDHASSSFASPSTMTYSPSQSPHSVGLGLDEDSLTSSADVTQHPAAMLCDLPCPSAEALCQGSPNRPLILPTAQTATPSSTANLLCLILISAVYSQLMVPLRTILTSSKMDSAPVTPPPKGTLLPLIRSSTLTREIPPR